MESRKTHEKRVQLGKCRMQCGAFTCICLAPSVLQGLMSLDYVLSFLHHSVISCRPQRITKFQCFKFSPCLMHKSSLKQLRWSLHLDAVIQVHSMIKKWLCKLCYMYLLRYWWLWSEILMTSKCLVIWNMLVIWKQLKADLMIITINKTKNGIYVCCRKLFDGLWVIFSFLFFQMSNNKIYISDKDWTFVIKKIFQSVYNQGRQT